VAFAFAGHAALAQPVDTWTSVRSKNFSIAGNASAADLRAVADRLEQFRWAFSRLYPQFKLENEHKTKIVIFKDAAAYYEFLPKRPDGTTDVGVAGYFQPGDDLNYITFALSSEHSDPFSTAVHEYFHSVLESNFDRSKVPPWANEGLAEYFETVRVENGKSIFVGGVQTDHLRLLRRSALIPLSEFFAITAADLKSMTPERRRLYYAEAWAVVHGMMQSGRLSLDDLLDGVAAWSSKSNEPGEQAAARYAKLEADVNRSVRGTFPQSPSIEQTEILPTFEPPLAEHLTSTQVSATLGDLLLHTGDLVRSETFLRQALAAKPDDAVTNGSFGVLLIRQDKPADAKTYLQRAIAGGSANPVVLFSCAFATVHEFMKGSVIEDLPDDAAQTVRSLLRQAISIEPTFSESYRLLALIDFVRDEQLDDAVSLLQKGLAIKHDDGDMQLLLARILLRREDVAGAGQIAQQISSTTSDTKRKAEADEIVKAVYEYNAAKSAAAVPVRLNITVGERQGLVILKRSWLTDEDVAQIDRERENNNYNRLIIRPVTGEQSIIGRIEKIICSGASITYRVQTMDGPVNLSSADFSGVRMTVAREGNNTFQIGCGEDLSKQLAVINFRPKAPVSAAKAVGELTAISFVADDFRLKTIDEMFAARLIAIDDDTYRRSGTKAAVSPESIRRSIESYLRKPAKDEERLLGSIHSIQCSTSQVDFRVTSGGKTYTFAHSVPGRVEMGWFTVASTQLPVACGSGPISSNAILTFTRNSAFAGVDGRLTSIEFVPDGFVP
jgi:tetratricopeptide (TPR) repeat protein